MLQKNFVLLVEDNPDDELLTILSLNEYRIKNEIITVRDGAEALDFLFGQGDYKDRDLSQTPQLILLDLKLPKVDGLEVLQKIREDERTKLLPVVILTSSREQTDLLLGYQNGANSYIVKPVDVTQFREAISKLGLYWLILNEPCPAV